MRKTVLVLGVIILGGCATSIQTYLPDGTTGYHIKCDGAALNMGDCFQKAGELCGTKGYELLTREGDAVPYAIGGGSASVNQYSGQAGYISSSGMIVNRSLFVRCTNETASSPP